MDLENVDNIPSICINSHQIILLTIFSLLFVKMVNAQASEIVTTDSSDITHLSNQQQQALPEMLGEDPENSISHLFVRDSEVLLAPSEVQLIFGVSYSSADESTNLRKIHNRTISLPVVISIGVTNGLESYISIPLVYAEQEYASFGDGEKNEKSGIGDILMGLLYRVLPETVKYPSITTSIKIQMPSDDSDDDSSILSPSISSGYWGLSSSLSFSKSLDPAVMFFSFGYKYSFEDEKYGINLKPGSRYFYSFGAGLSINSAISLSGWVSGSYSEELEIDGEKQVGTSIEPISFVLTNIYRISKQKSIETFVEFGLNEDANSTSFGFNYIYNL